MKNKAALHLGIWVFTLTAASAAWAAEGINSVDLLDNILDRFANTADTWAVKLIEYGSWLFWSLALLSMIWTFGFMALRRADLQELLAEILKFFASTGFFYWLLINGPQIAKSIIDSMRLVAAHASGLSKQVSPSRIIDIGFDVAFKAVDQSSIWSPAASTVGLIIAGIILIVLALVAINMLRQLIAAWILMYAGVFLLGFGGGRWTQDIAINYYKTVLALAVKLFTMVLIVGIGKSFIDQYYKAMQQSMSLKEMYVMLVVAIILYTLMETIPPMLASIVTGAGIGQSASPVGAGDMMAAASMAAMGASSMASTVGSTAANMGGGGQALKAAFTGAQKQLSSSSSMSSSSASRAGQMALSMGSQLAQGAGRVMGEKIGAMGPRVSETLGGKIAGAINSKIQDRGVP